MNGYVYHKTAPPDTVRALLSAPPAKLDYILQELATDIVFAHFSAPGADWQPWERGRAFGQEIEVRWQRSPNGNAQDKNKSYGAGSNPAGAVLPQDKDTIQYDLLILSEVRQETLSQNGWQERLMETRGGGKVYLWGRHCSFLSGAEGQCTRHEWLQASIPRPLSYPLETREEFAYIETVDYCQEGMIVLTRFREVSGETREEAR